MDIESIKFFLRLRRDANRGVMWGLGGWKNFSCRKIFGITIIILNFVQ